MAASLTRGSACAFWHTLLSLLSLALVKASAEAPYVLSEDLAGSNWSLTNSNGNVSLPAVTLPGYVLSSLHKAGLVDDPLWRYGEWDYRWVAMDNWTYSSTFLAADTLFTYTNVDLVLTDVDMVADITVNAHPAVALRNAAKEHRINILPLLVRGNNSIQIKLSSAVTFAFAEKATYDAAHEVSVPFLQDKGMLAPYNYVRKRPSDFGWNWAPAFAAQGIAGMLALQAYNHAFLKYALVSQLHTPNSVQVHVSVTLQVPRAVVQVTSASDAMDGVLTLTMPQLNISAQQTVTVNPVSTLQHVNMSFAMLKKNIELWWPQPLGKQVLYNLSIAFQPAKMPAPSSLEYRIGFREIKLGLDPVPLNGSRDNGETFYFVVNGVPLYAKGTNVVPTHFLPTEVADAEVEALVLAASNAHMNMIRVWGGGGFQPDYFYDLCDEHGILIMQDMMFAASPYPANDAYVFNILGEVEYYARRLGSHPSIAMWIGNSEVDASLYWGWFWGIRERTEMFHADYEKLFLTNIGGLLKRIDPSRVFFDSSPAKGFWDAEQTKKRWEQVTDPRWGTAHFWDTVQDNTDCQDMSIYPKLRFVGEWGFTSSNSFNSLKHATDSQDWTPWSDQMAGYRNRQVNGENYMAGQMAYHFKMPAQFNSSTNHMEVNTRLYKSWIYFTQVQQAECLASGMQRWRTMMSDPEACTMGVLYWQLNGIWQSSNDWSTVDYNGNWKPSHHVVKKVFEPVTLHTVIMNDTFQVFAVNDLMVEVTVLIHRELLGWYDECLANRTAREQPLIALVLPPVSTVQVSTEPILDRLPLSWRRNEPSDAWSTFVRLTLRYDSKVLSQFPVPSKVPTRPACQRSDVAQPIVPSNVNAADLDAEVVSYWQPTLFKDLHLKNPSILLTQFRQLAPDQVSFVVSSQYPAGWVVLETSKRGQFSENGFTLYPCYPMTIVFTAMKGTTVDALELRQLVRCTSMFDHQEALDSDVASSNSRAAAFSRITYNATTGHVLATPVLDPATQTSAQLLGSLISSTTIRAALDNTLQPAVIASILRNTTQLAATLSKLPTVYGLNITASTPLNLTSPFDATALMTDMTVAFQATLPASPPPLPSPSPPMSSPPSQSPRSLPPPSLAPEPSSMKPTLQPEENPLTVDLNSQPLQVIPGGVKTTPGGNSTSNTVAQRESNIQVRYTGVSNVTARVASGTRPTLNWGRVGLVLAGVIALVMIILL